MKDTINPLLDDVVTAVIEQQGLSFSSLQEAERYKANLTGQLDASVEQAQAIFSRGLQLLGQTEHSFVRETVQQLQLHQHTPAAMKHYIETVVHTNPRALEFFSEAANSFYDCGDYQHEQDVIAVLLALFPFSPQPYIFNATLLWRQHGIEVAALFYRQCADFLKDPLMDYFAADCYLKNGEVEQAKQISWRALETLNQSPESHPELTLQLQDLQQQCCGTL